MTASNPTGGEIGYKFLACEMADEHAKDCDCQTYDLRKQLDALKAENERLHQEYSKGYYTPTKEAELKFLRAENARLRGALEEISKFDHLHMAEPYRDFEPCTTCISEATLSPTQREEGK